MTAINRGDFVKLGSLFAGGLVLGVGPAGCMNGSSQAPSSAASADDAGFKPNAWLIVHPDDKVTVFVSKSEMGQGVATGFSTIVADELDIPFENVLGEPGQGWQVAMTTLMHERAALGFALAGDNRVNEWCYGGPRLARSRGNAQNDRISCAEPLLHSLLIRIGVESRESLEEFAITHVNSMTSISPFPQTVCLPTPTHGPNRK